MPSSRSGGPPDAGILEQLLAHNQKISELEADLRSARTLQRSSRITMMTAAVGSLAIFVATTITYRKIDLGPTNRVAIPLVIICIISRIVLFLIEDIGEYRSVAELKLDLEIAQERKRLYAANLDLGLRTRQFIYKDGIPTSVDQYRVEGKYYRRIHNYLQSIIIVGSLASSTLAGMANTLSRSRWYLVGTSFSVGIAAGFTGYFKFRERSFYLQQTADQIELEINAADLGIGRYKGKPEASTMTELTEQVEALRNEQRKRQQQLDQPTETPEG